MKFTDEQRSAFLKSGGYVPDVDGVSDLSGKDLVDWCLEHGYGPAYWRYPKTGESIPTAENGMVFVRPCDRSRIDELLEARITVPIIYEPEIP